MQINTVKFYVFLIRLAKRQDLEKMFCHRLEDTGTLIVGGNEI